MSRDDFSAGFAMMYGLLVFLKCFHWITADRVDYVSLPILPVSGMDLSSPLLFVAFTKTVCFVVPSSVAPSLRNYR
jgi:hypothetical protein